MQVIPSYWPRITDRIPTFGGFSQNHLCHILGLSGMGNGNAQPDDKDVDRETAQDTGTWEWEETSVHPTLAGDDLSLVEQGTGILLYQPDNPRAWIQGEAIQVGIGEGTGAEVRRGG